MARYGSIIDCPVPACVSIHTFAAWQAWKYSSSVDSAGASTLVVTPPGEIPMAPGGGELVDVDGRGDECVGLSPPSLCEQAATAVRPAATTSSAQRGGRPGNQCTVLIYATLLGVMECSGFWECCRP